MSEKISAVNYNDADVFCLAIEAIQKARECIYHSKYTGRGVPSMGLEVLAALIEWKSRYLRDLGKIKYFMTNHPLCLQKFELRLDERNTVTESYIIQERIPETPHAVTESTVITEATDPLATSFAENEREEGLETTSNVEGEDWDEYSMAGDQQDTVPDLMQLSEQAIATLKSILLTRVRSDPVHSMGLTALNSVSTWSRTYAPLKSMKKWINFTLPTLPLPHKLVVIDGRMPGTDIVQWADSPAPSPITRPLTTGAGFFGSPPPIEAPIVTYRGGQLVVSHPVTVSHRVDSIDAGVQVRDFFHIPMIQNGTETSYLKSTKKTTDMFAYFVKTGALRASLEYGRGQFDELEWRGDAVLHLEITNIQFVSQANLYDVGGLSIRRQNAEQRLTLALLFDDLRLAQFVRVCPESWTRDSWKVKGDFVEAMIGELYTRLHDATEEGLPFGHPDRRAAFDLIKRLAQAALERGLMLISHAEQDKLRMAAEAPGGGGFLLTADDRDATIRCSNSVAKPDWR